MESDQIAPITVFVSLLILKTFKYLAKRYMLSGVLYIIIKISIFQLLCVCLCWLNILWLEWFGEDGLAHPHGVGGVHEVLAWLQLGGGLQPQTHHARKVRRLHVVGWLTAAVRNTDMRGGVW